MPARPPLLEHQNPLFIPGPTNIPECLRRAMDSPSSDHRASDFADLLVPLLDRLRRVYGTTTGQVLTFPASGTGGWEAAITNTLVPGDKVLAARHGMFSQRWIELCKRHGIDVEVVECEWGEAAPAARFAERLAADAGHHIKAVLVTHNETSTGVLSNVDAVRKAIDASAHPAMLFVDCVSSLGCMPFEMDAWGVDIAVAGSQKGFMLATGLAIVGLSPRALDAAKASASHRSFFDFPAMAAAGRSGNYPYTPALQLLKGLRTSVDLLLDEGLDNVYARHARIAGGVRSAVHSWDFSLCAVDPATCSNSVTTIRVPPGFDGSTLIEHAYDTYGVSYGIGLGPLAGKVFRIGHLGAVTDVMALAGIATAEMAMHDLGFPIQLGRGVAAAQAAFARSVPTDTRLSA